MSEEQDNTTQFPQDNRAKTAAPSRQHPQGITERRAEKTIRDLQEVKTRSALLDKRAAEARLELARIEDERASLILQATESGLV